MTATARGAPHSSRHVAGKIPRLPIGGQVVLETVAVNILSLGLPLVMLHVYDRIIPNGATGTFGWLILGLAVVLLLDAGLQVIRGYVVGWEAARLEHVTSCGALNHVLESEIDDFEKDAPGVHLSRFQAIDTLRDYYAGQARLALVDLPFVFLFLALIWLIGGAIVIIPVVLLFLLALAAFGLGSLLKEAVEDRVTLDSRRYSFVLEVLEGIHTIKLLGMETLMQRRYERLQEQGASGTYRTVLLSNAVQSLGVIFSRLTIVMVAGFGGMLASFDQLTIGGLAACTLLAGRCLQTPLRSLALWTQFQKADVARRKLGQLFDLRREPGEDLDEIGEIRGELELRDVSFGYAGGKPVLSGLNLKAAPGEVVGISGKAGCGKSTLLMVTMGLLKPTSGQVLFDGIDTSERDPHSLRQQIAYLPQNEVLFQGTILENLTLFRGSGSVEACLSASRLLGLDLAIHRLPAGYHTKVGDGADNDLPAGVKQTIAMARALANGARVILFDEANNALDRNADEMLKTALARLKGKVTMVMVSQRPSLLALADHVYDLRQGDLVLRKPRSTSTKPRGRPGSKTWKEAPPARKPKALAS